MPGTGISHGAWHMTQQGVVTKDDQRTQKTLLSETHTTPFRFQKDSTPTPSLSVDDKMWTLQGQAGG